jgi:hypothetical protein
VLLVFEKAKENDPKYPRRFNKILKQPLWGGIKICLTRSRQYPAL